VSTNGVEAASQLGARIEAVQQYIAEHLTDGPNLHFFLWSTALPPYVTAHGVMVLLAAALLWFIFGVTYRKKDAVPTGWTNALEVLVLFIRDGIAVPSLGEEDGRRMTPLFCSLFFFILAMNLIGLVPCFSAATANVSVTAALAVVVFCAMVFGAMYRQGPVGFFKAFIPHGVPWPVLVILLPIEILGLFVKSFALCIRLFANEFAGHIVVFFLLGLVVVFGAAGIPFILLGAFVYVIEVGVAFMQAYIFTLLAAVFIGQRLHPEH
jgi:F-type H+-transporting ATPase subunit a